jgi:enoyl-[acyl-carrier-protein] reductase (NADH)
MPSVKAALEQVAKRLDHQCACKRIRLNVMSAGTAKYDALPAIVNVRGRLTLG